MQAQPFLLLALFAMTLAACPTVTISTSKDTSPVDSTVDVGGTDADTDADADSDSDTDTDTYTTPNPDTSDTGHTIHGGSAG